MREIKFKYVWRNKFTKEFFAHTFTIEEIALRKVQESIIAEKGNFDWELIARLQCTGLKDKNGEEIYEGDIVHITTEDLVNMNYKAVVEWNSSGFYSDFINYDEAIIIGNIYENPKLKERNS